MSAFGDWMVTVALMALVLKLSGSSTAVGGILVLRLIPAAIGGPLAARAAGRWDRRRTMLAMDLVRMGIVALMGLVATIAVGNLDKKAIKELDWNYLLFFGVALGVAGIAVNLKLDRAFGDIAASQLSAIGTTPAAFIVLVFIVSTVTQLCINKSQGVLLLSMALIPVASV